MVLGIALLILPFLTYSACELEMYPISRFYHSGVIESMSPLEDFGEIQWISVDPSAKRGFSFFLGAGVIYEYTHFQFVEKWAFKKRGLMRGQELPSISSECRF